MSFFIFRQPFVALIMTKEIRSAKWIQRFSPDWLSEIENELHKDYLKEVLSFLHQEKLSGKIIYPQASQVFNAFYLTPFNKIKVVILGQDPYHGYGQAHGLSFSVQQGVALPPSLRNIYKELKDDLGIERGNNGCLSDWAEQGVLMLNSSLTVEQGKPMSHQKIGWEIFTDEVIRKISVDRKGIIFILWGRFASQKEPLIDHQKHYILKSAHPSPLSAFNGFLGSKPFSQTNRLLEKECLGTIHW